jgi:transcriptional regulator with XRE-family HTH domain
MLWATIQKILDKRNWTLRKLSKESDIKYDTLARYKSGRIDPSFSKACQIADALNISLDKLRERKEEN